MSIQDDQKEERKQEFLPLLEGCKEHDLSGLLAGSFESYQKLMSCSLTKENK